MKKRSENSRTNFAYFHLTAHCPLKRFAPTAQVLFCDLWAMLPPFSPCFSHYCQPFTGPFTTNPKSSSVASVTSVRCFPCSPGSRTEATPFTGPASPAVRILLCDLRDLCAMLSLFTWLSHRSQPVHSRPASPAVRILLCDLRDLCAMLSLFTWFSH